MASAGVRRAEYVAALEQYGVWLRHLWHVGDLLSELRVRGWEYELKWSKDSGYQCVAKAGEDVTNAIADTLWDKTHTGIIECDSDCDDEAVAKCLLAVLRLELRR